jgi:hypothetical protein
MRKYDLHKLYGRLTVQERFDLFAAAYFRGDRREMQRLRNAGPRWRVPGQEPDPLWLLRKVVSRMVNEIAEYCLEVFAGASVTETCVAGVEPAAGKLDQMGAAYAEAAPAHGAGEAVLDGQDEIDPDQLRDWGLASGYLLKTWTEGWKLFCERRGIAPFMNGEDYERVERALELNEVIASQPSDLLRVYSRRTKGQSEPIVVESPEEAGTGFEQALQVFEAWWGGCEDRTAGDGSGSCRGRHRP